MSSDRTDRSGRDRRVLPDRRDHRGPARGRRRCWSARATTPRCSTVDSPVITSTDVLVEGVHFRRDWTAAADVGRKAVAVNVADLEAMGGRAVALLVGLLGAGRRWRSAGRWTSPRGCGRRRGRPGSSLVGGDVTRARDITIAVTVLGVLRRRAPVRRSGARPGDVVAVRRPAGLGRRRADRARPRVPLAARRGRGVPGARSCRTGRGRGRRGRRDGDDRRLRRAAGRPRPRGGASGVVASTCAGRRSRCPSRCRPWPRRPARTRTS